MQTFRKLLLLLSAPLVILVLVGAVGDRVTTSTDSTLRDLKAFSETLYLVEQTYVEEVQLGQLERGAFQGLAESLDPWSSYYDPARMDKLLARDESGDVGLLLVKTGRGFVRVAGVVPGSPAEEAELVQGRFIQSIDGMGTTDLTLLEASHMLRGPVGTEVKLGFPRGYGEEEGQELSLKRENLSPLRVVSEMPLPGLAVLRVTDMDEGITDLVKAELRKLKAANVKGLVLDLRANLGGETTEAASLADLFVDEGTMFQTKGRRDQDKYDAKRSRAWKGPLVTLIGASTIGEAEAVAEALRNSSTLLGQPTFGKRSRQDLVRLADGSGLYLTVGEYLTAAGETMDVDGVKPEEEVARLEEEPPEETQDETTEAGKDEVPGGGEAPELPQVEPDDGGKDAEGRGADEEPDAQLQRALEILQEQTA